MSLANHSQFSYSLQHTPIRLYKRRFCSLPCREIFSIPVDGGC